MSNDIQLTEIQRQVILGSLLGSMYIGIPKGNVSPRIQFAHSVNERDYFELKMSILVDIISANPTCNDNTMRIQSIAGQYLKPIYDLVVVVGKKKITQRWLDEITDPMALAMWFMDSASVTGGVTGRGTQISFSMGDSTNEECVIVKNWLKQRWGIESNIYFIPPTKTQAMRRSISITSKENTIKLLDIVNPHLVQSSLHKINKLLPQYRGEPRPPTPRGVYTCEICGKDFETHNSIGGHSNIHRNIDVEPTDFQKQVILGSLLGDMWIYRNGGGVNPEFGVTHSTNQREYILWKYNVLHNLARGVPEERDGTGYGKGFRTMHFHSRSLPCLIPILEATHREGKKCVTREWLDMINNPVALAVWYMDDGCRNKKTTSTFALGKMANDEGALLQSFMKNKWGIETKLDVIIGKVGQRDNTQLQLRTNKADSIKLWKLIEPYVIPSMRYKIDPSISYKECICA